MTQHTPGPDDVVHIIPNLDPTDWCAVIVEGKEQFIRYSLIAAAPEMVALLKLFSEHATNARQYDLTGLCADARALLAQIEGSK